jgi:hypothetical protein
MSQTGSEVGINFLLGPNLEFTQISSVSTQNYFYNQNNFQMGFHYGVGAYYNYYFDKDYYVGLKTAYRHLNTTFLEYEPELINIDGQAVEGEFEHYFEYNLDAVNLTLNGGYRLNQQFSLELGLLCSMPVSDYQSHSKETIVKPADAGVFKEEGTRVRNNHTFSIAPNGSKVGASIGVSGLFPMNKTETIFLKPSVSYSHLFTNNLEELKDWTTDHIDLSVGISFALGNGEVLGKHNKVIEPEFAIALFELNGTTERTLKELHLQYIVANDLLTSKSEKLVMKTKKLLIAYVGVKNKLDRHITFEVLIDNRQEYKLDNLQESNRLEIGLDNIVHSTKDESLEFRVETNDGFTKSIDLPIKYKREGELSYIARDNLNDVLNYIKAHINQKYELFTNDKSIYKLLSNIEATNITVLPKENFPYHIEEFGQIAYILLVK